MSLSSFSHPFHPTLFLPGAENNSFVYCYKFVCCILTITCMNVCKCMIWGHRLVFGIHSIASRVPSLNIFVMPVMIGYVFAPH